MLSLLLTLVATPADTTPTWTPHRVYDTRHKRFADLESLAATLVRQDVVFFGEQHDDPGTHRMQRALLEAIARRRSDVVLSLEMFERDVQLVLDDYLADRIPEAAFLKAARPWPNYATDYRPLIEFAKAQHWRVVSGNVPRRIASTVAKLGLPAAQQLPDSARRWAAEEFHCPRDSYFDRFVAAIGEHPMGPGAALSPDSLRRVQELFYQAQCVKDETMAESIVRARTGLGGTPLVVHMNGDFHSSHGAGAAERVRRRLPKAKVVVISAVPVVSLDDLEVAKERKRADWLILTLKKS